MGDVAMIVPVLRAFSVQYPQAKITVVSRSFFKPFFSDIENFHFFEIDVKQKHKGFVGLLRLFSGLKQHNITHFADLHNVLRSKIVRSLFRFTGIPVAFVNKARKEKKELTRLENKIFKPLKPMTERHAEVFRQLGFPIDLNQPVFPKKTILSQEILSISGEKSVVWIGIAPFAQYDSKVYPLDLMQEVIDKLALDSTNTILLFGGGKKEVEILDSLSSNKKNVINMAGKIKFQQELQLISNLDVMLSMDSGNTHIAAMLGVKVITLWGATHPYAGFSPFNQPMEHALVSNRNQFPKLPTSVYGNKKVKGYEDAMRTILPQTIVLKVKNVLLNH